MNESAATGHAGHQTITKAKLAMRELGDAIPGLPAVMPGRDSFATNVEQLADALRGHLKARGWQFPFGNFDPVLPGPRGFRPPDREKEVAENYAATALHQCAEAREALAAGTGERAASLALLAGECAGMAMMMFYREQDAVAGRMKRVGPVFHQREEIMARARSIWEESAKKLTAKELLEELHKAGVDQLPRIERFQALLTDANWRKWPHPKWGG